MTFDFNETCIVNQMLTTDSRAAFIQSLIESREHTEEPEICASLDSLIDKMSALGEDEFKKLWKDRMDQKIFTFPPYSI